ncbi:MAG: DUF883 family protein [Gammaproteobacteria bacterium]|jgi:ElaB/YqjD/DUF883 family membrane-anchored ribosome-binding protein|nr:DUF883 family protein [Gammaproteobacteria bacterium]
MATATDKEVQELRNEIAALKEELSNIGNTVSNIARSATDEGRERVRAAAEHSREQARQTWGAFEREVEERPMTSIAAALGIGFILGKLLDR